MPRWLRHLVGVSATVLCFTMLWQMFPPSGPSSGLTTLILAAVSGFIGVLVSLTMM